MDTPNFGELTVIAMRGTEDFSKRVVSSIAATRKCAEKKFLVEPELIRFRTGEGKCIIHESMRGRDVYIITDLYNYSVTYNMFGLTQHMSPDDHYQDLKRIIGAIGGKARRITVIMPLLYESRQDKRSSRESLDCALALQELLNMGISNILTFDVHNSSVQNAIPLAGFDNVQPSFQMISTLIKKVPDIDISPDKLMIVSPDVGGMSRCVFYASILKLDLGMFYKRRDYTRIENGKNPIEAHEYLGNDLSGKDAIIIDDMISSGQSILEVAQDLKERGAGRIFIFASFGLFHDGLGEFDKAFSAGLINKIFTTNLIYRTPELLSREWYCEVNMCKYVSLLINTLNADQSISPHLNSKDRIINYIDNYKAKKVYSEQNN